MKKEKIERAIEILDPNHAEYYESLEPVNEACRMGMEALKKQIPEPLNYEGDGYDQDGNLIYDIAKCPVCEHEFEEGVNDWGSKYCPGCGQALDWDMRGEQPDEEPGASTEDTEPEQSEELNRYKVRMRYESKSFTAPPKLLIKYTEIVASSPRAAVAKVKRLYSDLKNLHIMELCQDADGIVIEIPKDNWDK